MNRLGRSSSNNNNNLPISWKILVLIVLLPTINAVGTDSPVTAPTRTGWVIYPQSRSSSLPPTFIAHHSLSRNSNNSNNKVPFDLMRLVVAPRGGAVEADEGDDDNGGDESDETDSAEEKFHDAVQEEEADLETVGEQAKGTKTQKEADPILADEEEEEEEEIGDDGMKWDAGEAAIPGETVVDDEEDSSANVDRMDYADAYDEGDGETTTGNFDEAIGSVEWTETVGTTTATEVEEEEAEQEDKEEKMISLAHEISDDMKTILIQELAYRRVDVQAMRPEIAAMVIAKKIRRPTEGLPLNWFVDENSAAAKRSRRSGGLLSRMAAPIVVLCAGAFVISETDMVDNINLPSLSDWLPSRQSLPSPTAVSQSADYSFVTGIEDTQQDGAGGDDEDELQGDEPLEPSDDMLIGSTGGGAGDESSASGGATEHSVRPGESPSPEPIDETFLDRWLTGAQKKFDAIFSKTI